MTTTVNIMLERRADALAIPNGAVRRDRQGSYVFVLRGEEQVRQPIRTGYRGRDYTEVLEGLSENDQIVIGSAAR